MAKRPYPVGVHMTPCKTKLGEFLRSRRLARKLGQTSVADTTGLGQSRYSQLETGEWKGSTLTKDQVAKLAKALGCKVEEIESLIPRPVLKEPTTDLGKLIKARREELGLSRAQLTKHLGKQMTESVRRLSSKGKERLSYQSARRLQQVLKIEPTELVKFLPPDRVETQNPLGQMIRRCRKELLLSGKALAKQLGMKTQHLNQLELGIYRPRVDNKVLDHLAAELKMEPAELRALAAQSSRSGRVTDNTLGGFLTARRREHGWSQRELAARAGLQVSLVSRVETQGRASQSSLHKLETALECQIPPELVPPKKKPGRPAVHSVRETKTAQFVTQKRLELGLSQVQLAEQSQLSSGFVNHIESGGYLPPLKTLQRLAEVLQSELPPEVLQEVESKKRRLATRRAEPGKNQGPRDTALGQWLTDKRLALGLNQREVARQLGINQSQVSLLERDKLGNPVLLQRIATVLQCEIPSELLPPDKVAPVKTISEATPPLPNSDKQWDLDRIRRLSPLRTKEEIEQKALTILRRLLEKQAAGYSIRLVKDAEVIELEFW